jgi:hypothetical protein
LDLEARFSEQAVTVLASSEGEAVSGIKFEALIVPAAGDRVTLDLVETPEGKGRYQGALPAMPAGEATFVLRDRTYPGELSEAQATFTWPPSGPLGLHLEGVPPGPNLQFVLIAILVPLAVAVLVVIWSVLRSRTAKPA